MDKPRVSVLSESPCITENNKHNLQQWRIKCNVSYSCPMRYKISSPSFIILYIAYAVQRAMTLIFRTCIVLSCFPDGTVYSYTYLFQTNKIRFFFQTFDVHLNFLLFLISVHIRFCVYQIQCIRISNNHQTDISVSFFSFHLQQVLPLVVSNHLML